MLNKLKIEISDFLAINPDFDENLKFHEDLGVDSLALIELIFIIEQNFDIQINYEDANKIESFADIKNILEKLKTTN